MRKPSKASYKAISSAPADPTQFYYKPFTGYFYWKRLELAAAFLEKLPKAQRCLELACGTGVFLPELARHCQELQAVDLGADLDDVRHMLSKESVQATLLKADICRLPFEGGFFDLLVGMSCMEHIHQPEDALREASRVLRPGGVAIFGVPVETPALNLFFKLVGFDHGGEHITRYSDVLRIAREVFAEVEEVHFPPWLPLSMSLYMVIQCRRG